MAWMLVQSDGPDERQAWDFKFAGNPDSLVSPEVVQLLKHKTVPDQYRVVFREMRDQRSADEWVRSKGGTLMKPRDILTEIFGKR